MSDTADLAPLSRPAAPPPPTSVAAGVAMAQDRAPPAAPTAILTPLSDLDESAWQALADHAAEPNVYYLPDWERAVNDLAPGRGGAYALAAWTADAIPRLLAVLPVVPIWHAWRIPLPALVSADPYGVLGTPLLHDVAPIDAARALLDGARATGHRALLLRDVSLEGAAMAALTAALTARGLAPRILRSYSRATLDATAEAEPLLRDALGAKKLKELRRQHARLADHGDVALAVARAPHEVATALEVFLALEASGWKARRGTAMLQRTGDAAFMRRAMAGLSARGACEIVTLTAGATPVAAAVVLRHRDRAFWFKIGVDERFAKFSPGVQLALALTRRFCADPQIRCADSTAGPEHPMINPIWRGRLAVGDVLIPLRRNDPIVALLTATLLARQGATDQARRVVRRVRRWRGQR